VTFAGPAPELTPGAIIGGRLRVERVLGRGGMGVVVAAHHLQLDTRVAIKFLHSEMLSDSEAVARFSREARAAVKITSEHVARVLDVGSLESGAPYIVMEFLEGRDLSSWLQSSGPMPVEQAVEFLLHACDALAEAHSLGIVHRDLKPSNLFCIRTPDGNLSVKVLDFGISKLGEAGRNSAMSAVTRTVALMGTPFYMSPEQMKSAKSADAQSDIWALGVILYELLSGKVPFHGEAITEIAVKVATTSPATLRGARMDVPRELEAIVMRCLEKDKAKRYPSVAELAVALRPFAPRRAHVCVDRVLGIARAGRTGSTLAAPSLQGSSTVVPPETSSPFSASMAPSSPAGRRSQLALVVSIVGVALGAAVIGGIAWSHRNHPGEATAAAPLAPASSAPTADVPAAPAPAAVLPPAQAGSYAPAAEGGEAVPSHAALAPAPAGSAVASEGTHGAAPGGHGTAATDSPRTHVQGSAVHADRPATTVAHGAAAEPGSAVAHPPPPASTASSTVQPGCDPPYTLDDQGRKHFKAECFLNH
jgi:serine/threonine-protein kinase